MVRQANATPIFNAHTARLHAQMPSISGKLPPGVAIRYALTRMKRLRPYLYNGSRELDNNRAELAIRSVAFGRKNCLFVGSLTGGRAAVIAYTLIEIAKLNTVDAVDEITQIFLGLHAVGQQLVRTEVRSSRARTLVRRTISSQKAFFETASNTVDA